MSQFPLVRSNTLMETIIYGAPLLSYYLFNHRYSFKSGMAKQGKGSYQNWDPKETWAFNNPPLPEWHHYTSQTHLQETDPTKTEIGCDQFL